MLSVLLLLSTLFFLPAVPTQAAPRIFYTDITSGPNTGSEGNNGAYLTLFGQGFGANLGSSTITIGGGQVARYMVWTDEKVSVQIGHNAASGPIVISTTDGSATARDTFTVRPGNFYFVSLTGSDSNGVVNDISRPFRTPNHVVRDLAAFGTGDFVVVRGGSYDLSDAANNLVANTFLRAVKSGTATSPITFMGYPGEDVVLQQNAANQSLFSNYETISHWVVADFGASLNQCADGSAMVAAGPPRLNDPTCVGNVTGHASDIRFVNIDIDGHDVGGMCNGVNGYGTGPVEIGYSDNVKILGVSIHNTGAAGGVDQRGHLIYLSSTQYNTEIGWNRVYNIPHSRALIQVHTDSLGGACYGQKKLTDITIHDNVIHDVAGQAILLDGGTGDISVYNNVIYNAPKPDDHRYEDIIALRGSGGMLNAKLYNNTVYANPNYTSQGWVLGIGSYMGGYCPESLTLYNNIFVVTEAQDLYYRNMPAKSCKAYITSNYNIWYGSRYKIPDFKGLRDRSIDPHISRVDLRLREGSPAIDKGYPVEIVHTDIDGRKRPIGKAIDIGAYEYSGVELRKIK